MKFDRLNDGSSNPPRLRVEHSLWSLAKLPMNSATEWTLDEKCRRIKEHGFEALETGINEDNEAEITAALRKHELGLVTVTRAFKVQDIRDIVDRAMRAKADFIWVQPADAFADLNTVVEIV